MYDETASRIAIHAVLSKSVYESDEWNVEGVVECFAQNGVMQMALSTLTGREEIAAGMGAMHKNAKSTIKRHHLTTSHVSFLAPDQAAATSYFLTFYSEGLDSAGHYKDLLVLEPDGWRIAHRKIIFDWISENSSIATSAEARAARIGWDKR